MVFIVALTFGPTIGGVAGGVGSALSDAISPGGQPFALFTLLIKGGEGLIAGYISQRGFKGREFVAWISGSLAMVAGYLLSESYFIGFVFGSSVAVGLTAALVELPFNVLQVFAGGLVGIPVSRILKRSLPSALYPDRGDRSDSTDENLVCHSGGGLTQMNRTLLPLTIRLPKLVDGSPPRNSLAPSSIMFMWLSQSIILPRYSLSFFSFTETSPLSFRIRRFSGFLDGSN